MSLLIYLKHLLLHMINIFTAFFQEFHPLLIQSKGFLQRNVSVLKPFQKKLYLIEGLSHAEREMVANVVRFNSSLFMSYEELAAGSLLDREEYLIIAKLTAILRVANALDRSLSRRLKILK